MPQIVGNGVQSLKPTSFYTLTIPFLLSHNSKPEKNTKDNNYNAKQ